MNSRPQGVPGKRVVQPVEGPHVDSVCPPERPLATVDEDAPHRARKGINRSQPRQHAGVTAWPGLDLDRHELIATPKQEVHFCPALGMRRPAVQVLEQSPLLPVGPQHRPSRSVPRSSGAIGPWSFFTARTKPGSCWVANSSF